MKKMLLVFNPKAGRREFTRKLYQTVNLFTRAGYELVVYPTGKNGDAFSLISERGPDFDIIVCSGGDGIVNEAVNAYMSGKTFPPLAYIPSGTTNDLAVALGLPLNIMGAAKAVLDGSPRMFDIGKFGDKYFSYVAAFGLFTEATYTTDQNAKNMFGRIAYLLEGIKQLANIRKFECSIAIDGETIAGNFILGIITNSSSVGGFRVQSDGNSSMDDGLFETIFVRSPDNSAKQSELMTALSGPPVPSEMIIQRSAKRVVVTSAQPINWTLDGEYGGQHTEVVIENLPRAMGIIVPAGKS